MTKYITESKVSLYADDTVVYTSCDNYIDIVLNMRIDIESITQWLRANKLSINVKKMKYMLIGSKNKLKNVKDTTIKINDITIERVPNFKYLGMVIDENLLWDVHIDKLYTKTCQKLGAVRKSRNCLNEKTALNLYKSLVLPHIDYGDVVYTTATKELLDKLQKVQNRACRIICKGSRYDSATELHQKLNLPKLKDRAELNLSLLCHKSVYNDGNTTGLSRYFIPLEHLDRARVTRALYDKSVVVPLVRMAMGRKAFEFRGPQAWNSIPAASRQIVKFEQFKSTISKRSDNTLDNHPT